MAQFTHELKVFGEFLRKRGLSLTKQRKSILAAVFERHDHFDAEDVAAKLRACKPAVGRATVYRTLSHMEECGLIQKLDLGHGHRHFEHILGHKHHEHLYCEECGMVTEFTNDAIEELIRNVSLENGYVLRSHAVVMTGQCQKCRDGSSQSTTVSEQDESVKVGTHAKA